MIKKIAAGAAKEAPALVFGPSLWLRGLPGGEWLHDVTTPSEYFPALKDVPGLNVSPVISETPLDWFWFIPTGISPDEDKENEWLQPLRLIQENESVRLRTAHHMAPWPTVSFPTNSKLSRDSATAPNRRDFHPLKAEMPLVAAGSSTPPRSIPIHVATPTTVVGPKRQRTTSPVPLAIPVSESPSVLMAYTRKYGASSRGSAARRIQRSYRRKRLSGKAALTKRVSSVNRNKNCLSVDGLIDMEKRKVYIFELTNPGQSTDERVYVGGSGSSLPFNPRIYTQDFGSTEPIGESTTIFQSTVIKADEDENTDKDRRFNMAAASKALCQPDPSGIYLSYVDLTIRLAGVVTNAYVHICVVRQKHRNLCGENAGYMWRGNKGLNTPSPTFPEAAGLFKNLANPLASNSICRDDYQVLHEQRILINSKTTVT